jgi:hypothetical protein
MNSFDDDNELGFFEEPRRRPPRDRSRRGSERRPQRAAPRRSGPPTAPNGVLRLAGLLALGIAIVVGLVVSCSGGSKGAYSSYLTAMKALAQDSASVGPKFAAALGTPTLTLAGFEADLTSWSKQEQDDYVAAQRLQPPGPLQSAHADALTTFQERAIGLAGIASTLTLAQSKHDRAFLAGQALASEAERLTASDIVWADLFQGPATQVLESQGVTNVIVPPSKIVTSPDIVSPHQLATVYQRLTSPATGGGGGPGFHDMTLVETSAVESGVSTRLSKSASTTVKASSSLAIAAVVQDSGTHPEAGIRVTLTVSAAGQSVSTQTQTVSQIAAGGSQTVQFTNLQLPPTVFGHNATITVSIVRAPKEAKLDNNSSTYPVLFLAP